MWFSYSLPQVNETLFLFDKYKFRKLYYALSLMTGLFRNY